VSEFWFARRFPVGHPRNAMGPVTREGWLVVFAFVAALVAGAVIGMLLGFGGAPFSGVAAFAALGIVAGLAFIMIAKHKGDHQRTVADYRRLRLGART
jgi:hypothetical protein